MEFSPQQASALAAIKRWHVAAKAGDGPQTFRLFGYAGTGKTTIAKQMMGFATKVQYASLTGKAALVLRSKGCENARTIHSMIYRSMDKGTTERDHLLRIWESIKDDPARAEEAAKLAYEIEQMNLELQQPSFQLHEHAFDREWVDPNPDDEYAMDGYFKNVVPPDLICIDECSMVDARIGRDLESFNIPILVLGDPAQLPPIGGGGYFTGTKERPVRPDALLTQIHRQAADNPVIELATRIRNGEMPPIGQYGTSRIVPKTGLTPEEWLEADQILVGRNATRNGINRRIRALRGFEGVLPCPGERVVCLRNNHDLGLLNGSMWKAVDVQDAPTENYFMMKVESVDDPERDPVTCAVHKKPFLGMPFTDSGERREANEFDYGHCITTHKAQGSEWPNVIYVDEWPGGDKNAHRYTGVTRASERVTVVKW